MCTLVTYDKMQLNTCIPKKVYELHIIVLLPLHNNEKSRGPSAEQPETGRHAYVARLREGRLRCFLESHTTIQASTTVIVETCL